jgi:hypothetical protein
MTNPDLTELRLEISAEDVAADDIDQMTRQFLSELREADVESVQLAPGGPAPVGTKSFDPVTTGAIVMTVLPVVLPKIIDMAQAWVARGSGRTIKFKGRIGKQEIEFEGPPEELEKLLDKLGGGKKK